MGSKATVTSKGQITLPKEVRTRFGLKTGDSVEFVEDGGRVWIKPRTLRASDLLGILHQPGMKAAALEEMNEAVGDYLAEDDKRIQREWNRGRK
jgi:antitoxin PrlF